ncbi:hypothetical protein [Kitasatospora sp. NPDC093806]|uniref:hypothetical protein n=1 Tax=Kitasatospora sp. NPDC093806 TaxID=3155075 RepID=UPI00341703F4
MRRPTLAATAAVTVIALAVLTGCDGGSDGGSVDRSAPSAGSATQTALDPADFDPAAAVARASKEPYAVSIRATTEPLILTVTARQNFNTEVPTGRQERKVGGTTREVVITADGQYHRIDGPGGPWRKTPIPMPSIAKEFDLTGYAPALLSLGPAARKGMETRDGVPVFHLSGHLDLEHLAKVSALARDDVESSGATGIDLDQWIDVQGRTRYAEKRMVVDGAPIVLTMAFGDYGPPETVDAPTVTTV